MRILKKAGSIMWRAAKSKTGRRLGKFGASTALTSVAEKKARAAFKDWREGRALRKRFKIYNASPKAKAARARSEEQMRQGLQQIYLQSIQKRKRR